MRVSLMSFNIGLARLGILIDFNKVEQGTYNLYEAHEFV